MDNSFARNLADHNFVPNTIPVPPALNRLLGLNLKFCPTPKPLVHSDLLSALPDFMRSIRLRVQFGDYNRNFIRKIYVPNRSFQPQPATPAIKMTLQTVERNLYNFRWTPTRRRNLNYIQQATFHQLRQRPDLKVVLADKNLGPALFTTEHFTRLCLDHLQDPTAYTRSTAPVDALLRLLRTRVRNWYHYQAKQFSYDSDWSTTAIVMSDLENTRLNVFYPLAKIHNPVLCIRPIVSNSASMLQGLSKWLDFQLQPFFRSIPSYLRSPH